MKSVRLGRFHGIALLCLGLILLMGQVLISVRQSAPEQQRTEMAVNRNQSKVWPFFGIMGGIMVVVGGILVVTSSKKTFIGKPGTDKTQHARNSQH